MVLVVIQFAFLIITSIHVYKTAKSNGYNAVLWTFLNVCAFLVIPFFLGAAIGVGVGIALAADVIGQSSVESLVYVLNYAMIAVGVAGVFMVLKHVSKLNEAENVDPPPPPGFFDLE